MESKSTCERCQGSLTDQPYVFSCSHECTFCPKCSATLRGICPNCQGILERHARPKNNG